MAELEAGASEATVARSVDASGTVVITIAGEVDMSNVDAVEAKLDVLLREAPEPLVFDLSALNFIDSSGIAVLIRAAAKPGRIELRNPSIIVERIVRATGLSDVLHVES